LPGAVAPVAGALGFGKPGVAAVFEFGADFGGKAVGVALELRSGDDYAWLAAPWADDLARAGVPRCAATCEG
jgi:hypothetical protein